MTNPASIPPASNVDPEYGGAAWQTALLWAGVALCLFGLYWHRMWEQWSPGRFAELAGLSALALAGAWLLHRFARWSLASGLVVLWCAVLVPFAGPLPVAATVLFAIAGVALGSALIGRESPALQCACGMMLCAGLLGWLLPLPIHFRWLYVALCLALVLLRRQALLQTFHAARTQWRSSVAASPLSSAFAIAALGLATTSCWLPTLQFDDLTYHLRLPWELMETGHYSMDPETHIWALGPWIADVVQAIPQVMARAEARGPVNALWVALAAFGVWRLTSALGGTARANWMAVALYASMPLTASLGGSMQTETATTALLAWLAVLIVRAPTEGTERAGHAVAILVGGLFALKLTAAAFAILLLPLAMWRLRRQFHIGSLLIAAVLVLVVCGSSYVYAAVLAGNPVFPLFNSWFQSPYLPATHAGDARWHAGFNVMLPWNLTFDTDRYQEIYDGGAGFIMVALAGAWLLALTQRRTLAFTVSVTALIALPLLYMQYLRYVFPALVVLVPVLVVATFRADPRRSVWLLAGLCALNLAFQVNSHWMLRTGVLKQAITAKGQDEPLFDYYVPERSLIAQLRTQSGSNGNVLLLDAGNPNVAELGSRGRTVSWYDPSFMSAAQQAESDPSGSAWVRLLLREKVTEVMLRPRTVTPAQRAALERLRAKRRAQVGEAEWWSLPSANVPR